MGVMLYNSTEGAFKDVQAMQKYDASANAWKECTSAQVQDNGVWVEKLQKPITYLYKDGDECTNITGGYVLWNPCNRSDGSFVKGSNYIYVKGSLYTSNGEYGCTTAKEIDFAPYKTLNVSVIEYKGSAYPYGGGIAGVVGLSHGPIYSTGVTSLDISSVNSLHKLIIYGMAGSGSIKVDKVWVEK